VARLHTGVRFVNPRALAPVVAFALAGCGTLFDLADGVWDPDRAPRVYGGVQKDLESVTEYARALPNGHAESFDEAVDSLRAFACIMLVDVPLSFVADTAALPWTSHLQKRRQREAERRAGAADPAAPPLAEPERPPN
jgi:uncharacterized protein YceK